MDSSRRDNAGDYAGASERVPVAAGNGELEEQPDLSAGCCTRSIGPETTGWQPHDRPAKSNNITTTFGRKVTKYYNGKLQSVVLEARGIEPMFPTPTSSKIQERLCPRGFRESKPSWKCLDLRRFHRSRVDIGPGARPSPSRARVGPER